MSANDSEHFARESRSPPGTPFKKKPIPQKGVGFLFDIVFLESGFPLIYRDLLAVLFAEAGRILRGGSPRIVRS